MYGNTNTIVTGCSNNSYRLFFFLFFFFLQFEQLILHSINTEFHPIWALDIRIEKKYGNIGCEYSHHRYSHS